MTIYQQIEEFNIDRKAASKLLKMSLRTIDRYVRQKRLSTRVVNGRVWLDRKEIEGLKFEKERAIIVDKVDMSTPPMSIDNNVDNIVDTDVDNVDNGELIEIKRDDIEGKIYQKLYVELKEEVKEKQERLEIANYRVGQLEAQVRNSIPLLEYHRESYARKKQEKSFKNKIEELGSICKRLTVQLKFEKFNKRIFLIILLFILALQPLWLLLIYK